MATPAQQLAPCLPGRIPSLDGLRALAIGIVVFAHATETWGAPHVLRPLSHAGNLGVRVFFVISGFLITTLLLRELQAHAAVSLRNFYARRSLRILPAFLAYVAVIQLLVAQGVIDSPPGDLLRALTFTMDYRDDQSWALNHIWSLSVEEQFYLLWGALFVLTSRRALRTSIIAMVLVPPVIRSAYLFAGLMPAHNPVAPARQFECVVDAIAGGALLSVFFNEWMARPRVAAFVRSGWCLGVAATLTVGAVGGYLITPRVYDSLGQSIVNVGLVLFVWHCVTTRGGWLVHALNWRPIMFLGVLSYSLYLWQQLFLNANSRSFLASFPVNIGMSVAAALVSYYVVERPFLEARKFFPHARSRPRSAAAGDRVPVTAASADRVDGTAVKIN